MKNLTTIIAVALLFIATVSKAQNTTAMDFNRSDCNTTNHHLFQDLDSGKAVVLFFYMPNCGMCPPPAKKVQTMMKNIQKKHPNMVKAYVMPFNNSTPCADVKSWVSTNTLTLFTALDSGAAQVAYYGGFGMPTVALLGGKDHRVMFATQGFSTSDTSVMRDSIMHLFGDTMIPATGINNLPAAITSYTIYPNPISDQVNIHLSIKENVSLTIDLLDMTGRKVAEVVNQKVSTGLFSKQFSTATLSNGNYLMRLTANGSTTNKKIVITH